MSGYSDISGKEDTKDAQNRWVSGFLDKILEITRTNVLNWCDVVNKFGVDENTKEEWKNIFTSTTSDNYKDLIDEVTIYQNKLMDEIERLLHQSEVICKELNIKLPEYGSKELTLMEEKHILKERIKDYEKLLETRHRQIQKLNNKEDQLCKCLDKRAKGLPLSPLPTADALEEFKHYLEALEFDKYERVAHFASTKVLIEELIDELNYKPSLDFERMVLATQESDFVVSDGNMTKLNNFCDSLKRQLVDTKEEIVFLRDKVRQLWEKLDEDPKYCDEFVQNHSGNSLVVLTALKNEVDRCEALRKANIEGFVKSSRKDLLELWNKCHLENAEREFEFFHTDLYTEDLLTLHDIEIQKMERYYSENRKIFTLLEERKNLWDKMATLEQLAAQPDRYKNRGGQLLKEEKERNTLSKRIPHIEEQLVQLAEAYLERNGKPFLSWGETLNEIIERDHTKHEADKKLKLSARKLKRDKTITPSKSTLGLTPYGSVQNLASYTPDVGSLKRKIAAPLHSAKRTRALRENNDNAPRTAPPKITINGKPAGPSRFSTERSKRIAKCLKIIRRSEEKRCLKQNNGSTYPTEYDEFEKDIQGKGNCRSTIFVDKDTDSENTPLAVLLPVTPHRPKTPRRAQSPHNIRKGLTPAPPLKLLF